MFPELKKVVHSILLHYTLVMTGCVAGGLDKLISNRLASVNCPMAAMLGDFPLKIYNR